MVPLILKNNTSKAKPTVDSAAATAKINKENNNPLISLYTDENIIKIALTASKLISTAININKTLF
jgi:hypothetical protein